MYIVSRVYELHLLKNRDTVSAAHLLCVHEYCQLSSVKYTHLQNEVRVSGTPVNMHVYEHCQPSSVDYTT